MSTPTPGPWWLSGKGVIRAGSATWIAKLYWYNKEANAKLIRAAPELLEGLQAMVLEMEYLHAKFGETGSGVAEIARAKATIRLAGGEVP